MGVQALGLGLGTYFAERGERRVVVGHDFRSYSLSIKQALTLGLVGAGCEVLDIGMAVTPMAYFAQFDLEAPCVAMVTASHNENGWTGVKMGAAPPLTFGPDEIGRLKEIVLTGAWREALGRHGHAGRRRRRALHRRRRRALPAFPADPRGGCACGNGTAGAFAPDALRRMGAEVIEVDCELDWSFPNYNPNPEDHAMLSAMTRAVRESGAELALGFDGDGDRCGVVDDAGEEIFADKIGLMLARDLAPSSSGREVRRRREIHRPLRHRPGAEGGRRLDRLLEDRPQLHQAQDRRDRRAGRVREVRPPVLQPAARARLRRRAGGRGGDPLHARPPSRPEAQ